MDSQQNPVVSNSDGYQSMTDHNTQTDGFRPFLPRQHYVRIGRMKILNPSNLDAITWAYFGFGLISIIGAFVMTVLRISVFAKDKKPNENPDFVFGVLLLVNLLFVLYYVFHGVFRERPYEIIVSVAAVLIVLLYCIVDYALPGNEDKRTPLKLVRLILICVVGPVDIALGITVAVNFFEGGDLMIRLVGANIQLQSMCKTFFMFTAFLSFDFQIVISLLILRLAVDIENYSTSEKLIIGIGVPLSLAWAFVGRFAARFENKILAYIFLALSITEPAYIVYLFEAVGQTLEKATSQKNNQLPILCVCIIAAGILGILIRIALVVLMCMVVKNFGKQLKQKLFEENA